MTERKKESLHIRVKRSWLKELQAASLMSERSQADIVEKAVIAYIHEHWDELRPQDDD